jgi:nicotinate phosphoribosyltransferase
MKHMKSLEDVKTLHISDDRRIHSATHEEILSGATTDIYFLRTLDILKEMDLDNVTVTAEIFPRKSGIFAGIDEVKNILKDKDIEMWALDEGEEFSPRDTVIRIKGPYREFGAFETVILGALASSCGWATAAREVKEACGEKGFLCFGARHVHPAVAPVMERSAVIGGATGASCILAAKLLDIQPSGTLPHAAMLISGDTAKIAEVYDRVMPQSHRRTVLIDTFKDEVEESLRIAELLGENLYGIRVDTPSERGGVTPGLIKELRFKLDVAGHNHVKIFVSGGLTPEKIRILSEAGADSFGVGSYISAASPIDMTMDIKEVEGKPVAKRGRIPGLVENTKLKHVQL